MTGTATKGPPQDRKRDTGESSASSGKAKAEGKTGDRTGLSEADNAAGGVDGRQDRLIYSAAGPGTLDGATLRQAFACFPSGVTAVCSLVAGAPVGMAASSFTSVSLDPPLVSVCVANESATWAQLRTTERLGVSVLSADHADACRQLAARNGDRFAGVAWSTATGAAILIDGAPLALECSLEHELAGGDHLIALLRIQALQVDSAIAPLVFHGSRFRRLAPDPEPPPS